jgi:Arginine methyltransferase oligomerization subdomain/Methyltransferase domain
MVFDKVRNEAYFAAIASAIGATTRVLDLGAGAGVLGLEAARLGAQKVYLVDSSAVVRFASLIARDNNLEASVEAIQSPVETLVLDEKVDVILSVFTGNFLLEEDLLPSLFQARDRFLAPGGVLIPDRAKMLLAPVSVPTYYTRYIDCWGPDGEGLDYTTGREYAVNTAYYDTAENFQPNLLGEPVSLAELDFTTASHAQCKATVDLSFTTAGICHGFIGWFDMRLGQNWLSTSPLAPATHWSQVFFPFRKPLVVQQGEQANLTVHRPQRGQWSWIVQFGDERQAHTTAMSAPIKHSDFNNRTELSRPQLSDLGRAISHALAAMDGSASIGAIADTIMADYPAAFICREDAIATLSGLALKFAKS